MMTWDVHPHAIQELREAFDHYSNIDEELGHSFIAHFESNRDGVCRDPAMCRIRTGSTRRVNLRPRFVEYYIAYTVKESSVYILAVGHAKRRPNYWKSRASEIPS